MSKESSSGLLSKMVKFVRNPRTDWADLETADAARSDLEEEASKQQLREMLERKRQNDFVRKREFDTLRKLRNKEIEPPQAMHSPSFFPSSEPAESDGDKQNTLEKIAVIEAQMASQWFKSQGAALRAKAIQTQRDALEAKRDSRPPEEASTAGVGVDPNAFAPTQTLDEPPSVAAQRRAAQAAVPASAPAPLTRPSPASDMLGGDVLLPLGMSAAYESSQFEVAELVNNPEVEEIAILYANGETTAAEEALLRMISPTGGRRDNAESWMALFDLYRATGQHLRFDEVGIEFAAVFGRSAPPWYSVPDQLAARGATVDEEPAQSSSTSHWTANSTLSLQNLALLDTLPQRVAPPWRLDWRYVKRIDAGCAQSLARKLNAWSDDRQVKLRFVGAENALNLLTELTPVADASVPQELWALRLALMRILGLMEDFELNALNFCVTYEVSPPAWAPPRCECLQIQPDGAVDEAAMAAAQAAAPTLPGLPSFVDSSVISKESDLDHAVARTSLAGQVLGDASSQFGGLEAVGETVELIEVDCRHVQRVDFVAAGTLLNWVADHQAKGQTIAFNNVNRLVAIFFRIIGIRELARVEVRKE